MSRNTMSLPCFLACSTAALAMSTGLACAHLEHGDVQLTADHLQLLNGGGTVYVAGNQQGMLAVAFS